MIYDNPVMKIARVVDGDTVDAAVDLGYKITTVQRYRITIVDTPERGEPGWAEAGEFAHRWLLDHYPLRVGSYKSDSFGRWLGDFYAVDGSSLSSALLEAGYAKYAG